jgi:tetratricopeptide (TPR) repeat protein
MNRGVALRSLKRLKEAIADHTKSIELGPTPQAHLNRAAAYEEDGQPDLALADYARAVELDPKLADAYAQRGLLLLRLARDAEAERDLDTAFRLNPALRPLYEPYARNIRRTRGPNAP